MLIKEVCNRCNLTKKAIHYYETQELIHPIILENGYRDFSNDDLVILKEISILRQCGISIASIRDIVNSSNKSAALTKYQYIIKLRIQQLNDKQELMNQLIDDYNINQMFDRLQRHKKALYTIKEKLVLAFPGNYGLYVAMHFGRFLNGTIETTEQQNAYDAIVYYLDNVDLHMSESLSEFFETLFASDKEKDITIFETTVHQHLSKMIADPETYLEQNHEMFEKHITYKTSDAYKQSPIASIQKSMLAFQRESGYQETFITNMKILSPAYAEYLKKIEVANDKMLKIFPDAKAMANIH
ncbi:MerR family transcriptional regulator [Fusibacter paucivorans]|uniref:MerR family transcriptional regulator n=1 Tax=Fusibacter paucivorans TaxID=76009 RepID=A0ABS5PSM3_9FIRM|nr:MerR family transcriptional regulator [Fusibacter paucivorans]MBS7527389.1 MerR family transcriptional regulator [Fusibacter paucivorans]